MIVLNQSPSEITVPITVSMCADLIERGTVLDALNLLLATLDAWLDAQVTALETPAEPIIQKQIERLGRIIDKLPRDNDSLLGAPAINFVTAADVAIACESVNLALNETPALGADVVPINAILARGPQTPDRPRFPKASTNRGLLIAGGVMGLALVMVGIARYMRST